MISLRKRLTRAAAADQRSCAYPDTGEAALLADGINDPATLADAMRRRNKSPALICAILNALDDFSVDGVIPGSATHEQMAALLGESALNTQALRELAELARENGAPERLLTAICAHAAADPGTIIETLWNAPASTARDVGLATGTLLAAATKWVRADNPSARWRDHRDLSPYWSYVNAAQRDQICALAQAWTTATDKDPDLRSFLITASFAFTDEHEMFAAGRAVTAAPTGPGA